MNAASSAWLGLLLCACSAPVHDRSSGQPGAGARPGASAITRNAVEICVIQDGTLRHVRAEYDPARGGDTLLAGVPLRQAHPDTAAPYAGRKDWLAPGKAVIYGGRHYYMNGLPRVLRIDELRKVGEFRNVPLFEPADEPPGQGTVFVPVSPGCVFTPYNDQGGSPVRSE